MHCIKLFSSNIRVCFVCVVDGVLLVQSMLQFNQHVRALASNLITDDHGADAGEDDGYLGSGPDRPLDDGQDSNRPASLST